MSRQTCTSCGHADAITESICTRCGAPYTTPGQPSSETLSIKRGQVFAKRYVVERMIGKGGMGCIYQVHDNTLNETVALKTLLPEYVREKQVVERFFNEARIARGLSHPHIVRVHDIGITEGMAYISMELLEGRTLRSMLDKVQPGRRIPLNAILRMFDALCAALDYAHKYTVHRDIKPENVMVLPDGTIKLMDFGISKLMSNPSLTSASMVMGTPHYMSPEQLKNSANVDGRADIYSVGVMLYESLTGDIPTGLSRQNDTLREVPAALDPIIARCCDKDPAKRYQTVAELRTDLRAIRKQIETMPPEDKSKAGAKKRSIDTASLAKRVAAIVVLAAVAAGMNMLWGKAEARRTRLQQAIDVPSSTVQLPPAAKTTSPSQPEPITFSYMKSVAQRAKQRASSALLTLNESPHRAQATRLMAEAEAHWELALESEASGTDIALNEGWPALHRFLAVALWPDGMAFVPEDKTSTRGTAGGGPFFVDTFEVSGEQFMAFHQANEWRWPEGAVAGTNPMTHITYYDAVAFLNSLTIPKTMPTADQWSRSLELCRTPQTSPSPDPDASEDVPDARLGWRGTPLDEWARSDFSSPDASQWFGRPIPVLGVTETIHPDMIAPMAFEAINAGVTFRGVWELPTSLSKIERLLN